MWAHDDEGMGAVYIGAAMAKGGGRLKEIKFF